MRKFVPILMFSLLVFGSTTNRLEAQTSVETRRIVCHTQFSRDDRSIISLSANRFVLNDEGKITTNGHSTYSSLFGIFNPISVDTFGDFAKFHNPETWPEADNLELPEMFVFGKPTISIGEELRSHARAPWNGRGLKTTSFGFSMRLFGPSNSNTDFWKFFEISLIVDDSLIDIAKFEVRNLEENSQIVTLENGTRIKSLGELSAFASGIDLSRINGKNIEIQVIRQLPTGLTEVAARFTFRPLISDADHARLNDTLDQVVGKGLTNNIIFDDGKNHCQ